MKIKFFIVTCSIIIFTAGLIACGTIVNTNNETGASTTTITTTTSTTTTLDTTAPLVVSQIPADGAADVAINTAISVLFSEAIDETTITSETFYFYAIETPSQNISGTISYDAESYIAILRPTTNLASATAYTVMVSKEVADLASNTLPVGSSWTFTTGSNYDSSLPSVESVSPLNNATGVAADAIIRAVFSKDMDASRIDTATFQVTQQGTGGGSVAGSVSYSTASKEGRFVATNGLVGGKTYAVQLMAWISDLYGNELDEVYSWQFETATTTTQSGQTTTTTTAGSGSPGTTQAGQTTTTSTTTTTIIASGVLDTNFNLTGYVTFPASVGYDVTTDNNNKLVISGYMQTNDNDMAIWRYNTDGSLDTSFNSVGYVTFDDGSLERVHSIAIDSNNTIYTGGYSLISGKYFPAIWAYNTDGSLDTSFNSTGYVTGEAGIGTGNYITSVAINSNDKILAGGYITQSTLDSAIWAYNTDGSLDTSFNSTGYVTFDSGGEDIINSITIDTDDKILGCGHIGSSASIWRYNTDGSLDTSFNSTGYVTFEYGTVDFSSNDFSSICIDGNDKILVSGRYYSGTWNCIIARYNSDGSLDTSFNNTGYVTFDSGGIDTSSSIGTDNDNKIVISGKVAGSSTFDAAIWRYNTDGSLDTSFNNVGYVTFDDTLNEQAESVIVEGSGHIIAVGQSSFGQNSSMMILKYK